MKKNTFFTRAAALIAAIALLPALTSVALAGDSPAYGDEVWFQDTILQDGVVLSDNEFWSNYYSRPRHEYYITYSPAGQSTAEPSGGEILDIPADDDPNPNAPPDWLVSSVVSYSAASGVFPAVYYGSSVCDRNTAAQAASYYQELGYRVLGIINGDFYNTLTGSPLGLLMEGGELLSSCGGYYAIGFRPDGSAVIGQPQLTMTAQANGQIQQVNAINKSDSVGITLWTNLFQNNHTSGSLYPGPEVIATIVEGKASIGQQMVLQVQEVTEGAGGLEIQPGQVVLSAPGDGYTAPISFLRSLTPGMTVTISFTTPDPSWEQVTTAMGALYLLVDHGVPQTEFEVSAAPRTAVGVKANGDVVFYTIDGRQSDHSMGCSLGVLAERMAELGCVTALCLDGGGSTTIMASRPNSNSASLVNSPSDGAQRKVSNLLVLLGPGGATGVPHAINLSTNVPAVLPGHTVEITANLADSHYYPMSGAIQFTSSGGTMEGNVLRAPAGTDTVTVTATHGDNISARLNIPVIETPEELAITLNGAPISSLSLHPGDTVNLGVNAAYNHRSLNAWAIDALWEISPELGSIDARGTVTAVRTSTDVRGSITATIGGLSVSIPVVLTAVSPFVDTAGHWASSYMTQLYYRDIFQGTVEGGGRHAYPDRGVTRTEFAVLLCRYMGLDTSMYSDLWTPFADMEQIPAWAADSVRAMYALEIIKGYTENGHTFFNPQGILSRSEAVTMLDRMLDLNDEDGNPVLPDIPDAGGQFIGLTPLPSGSQEPDIVDLGDLAHFEDAEEIQSYAVEHFKNMVKQGVIEGSGGYLRPNAAMTRAEISKVLATLP